MSRTLQALLLLAIAFASVSCERTMRPAPSEAGAPRIASFSPALTSMLISIGLEDCIVGRSAFCRIDPSIPVVGDLHEVDYERLVRLVPSHVLVQSTPDSVDPGLAELASEHGWVLLASPLEGVGDIRSAYESMPDAILGPTSPYYESGQAVVRRHASEIEQALQNPIEGLGAERVLILSPMEPPLAWGSGTWMDDLLTALGGVNAVAARGWVPLGWEDLLRIEADRIVFVSESDVDVDGTLRRMLDRRRDTPVDVLIHPEVHLPATSTAALARALRAILDRSGSSS